MLPLSGVKSHIETYWNLVAKMANMAMENPKFMDHVPGFSPLPSFLTQLFAGKWPSEKKKKHANSERTKWAMDFSHGQKLPEINAQVRWFPGGRLAMLPLATCGWDVGMFTGSSSGPNKDPLARPEIPGRDRIYQRPKKMPKGVSRMAEMMFPTYFGTWSSRYA